jgi:hypothetical protein
MAIKNEDTVAGAGLTALGGVAIWYALGIRSSLVGGTLPPNFFPILCATGLIICGLILMIRGLRSGAGPLPKIIDSRVAIVGGLLIVFYWFFADIDFRVGAAVLAFVTMWMFGHRSVLLLTLLPLGLGLGLYFAFTRGFNLVLPTWN